MTEDKLGADGWDGEYDEDSFVSAYFEILEEYPNAAYLASEDEAREYAPLLKGGASYPEHSATGADLALADRDGLPLPMPYEGKPFSVLDYQSEEYAAATNIDDAIAMRGEKAFFEKVRPEDFDVLPQGVERLGISELWMQSTWYDDEEDGRNINDELSACLTVGDVLVVGRIPSELPDGQNWGEIQDLGFGFYHGAKFLPYTPYHDYDQQLFLNAIKGLGPGEWIECLVREANCNGGDAGDVEDDLDFCWRVYSCEIVVFKVRR